MKVGFGEVVEVKKVRSLGVCRVSIELPVEAYKAAVQLLDSERVLIVPSNLKQGFGILAGSETERAFSGHVVPEQIGELPTYEGLKVVDRNIEEGSVTVECSEQQISGIQFDELDVPEADRQEGGGEPAANRQLTGGQLARHLDAIGTWRNPAIWRALCGTQAARDEYRSFVADAACMCCGHRPDEDGAIHPHHWRKLETGGGTSLKPEDFWCVPLCSKHHTGEFGVHSGGTETWCAAHGFTESEVMAKAIALMAAFNRENCKERMHIDSMREVTPEHIEMLENELGVKI